MKISNKKMVIHAESLSDNFLFHNKSLIEFEAPNLEKVSSFLFRNISLKELNAPNLKKVGDCFLAYNENIDTSKYR